MQAEIIIVGAGAAGLMAAKTLSQAGKKVVVLDARNRIGGRIHTIQNEPFMQPVETGAEFVHGNLALTLQLLKEAGLQPFPAEGAVWRCKDGCIFQQDDFIEDGDALMQALEKQETETSVGAFLQENFNAARYADLRKSVQGYIEGYYAGILNKASVLALKEEWQREEEPQYRVQGGYTALLNFLYDQCIANGVNFYLSAPVKSISWGFEKVVVTCRNGQNFSAQKTILTVPVPVLQNTDSEQSITFSPAIPEYKKALQELGHGNVIKIVLQFKTAFWKEAFGLESAAFIFSDEVIPTWWTQHPQQSSLLVGWCAGPHADRLKNNTGAELFQKAMQSLAKMFNLLVSEVENNITASNIYNWAADPFTQGGYSYITTTTKEALRILLQPIVNTIYFAGEGLYDNINVGTVEAALQSGKQTAEMVRASFTV